jgi:hypothetical protein
MEQRQRERRWLGLVGCCVALIGCAGSHDAAGAGAGGPGTSTGSGPTTHEPGGPGCGLDAAAFCETFDAPHPGGYAGDLDEARWNFSRNEVSRLRANSFEPDWLGINEWSNPDGPPVLCGQEFNGILPPGDAVVCQGQFSDVMFGDGLPINSFMIRQPFDFTDRTGALVFEVDAKRNDGFDGHGWWLELWITDQPTPIPYHEAPTVQSIPRNGVGIQIAPFNDAFDADPQLNQLNGVNGLVVARDGVLVRDTPFGGIEGPAFRVRDEHLNRFRVELSRDHIEIWATHWDEPETALPSLRVDGIDLNFTVGYVHFQHVHYNPPKTANCPCDAVDIMACNAGCECEGRCSKYPQSFAASITQVYRWDNIGFDGPVYPTPRAYVVPPPFEPFTFEDNGVTLEGVGLYHQPSGASVVLEVPDVDPSGALGASFHFTSYDGWLEGLRVRFNGGVWHDAPTLPLNGLDGGTLHTYSVDVPLDELVPGTNSVEIETEDPVGNVDLTLHPSG